VGDDFKMLDHIDDFKKLTDRDVNDIKNVMENIHKLEVPLIVDAKYGINWAEMSAVSGSASGGEKT